MSTLQSPPSKNGFAGLDPLLVNRLLGFALLVLVGAIVLFLRNPDPILNPALYAEDAAWSGLLLQGDRWGAYFYSRRDYLVFGQTMLLDLGVSLNLALTGGTIALLPETLALLSYGFWSFYAALTFVALRSFLPFGCRLLAIALILLLPLGAHGNEVLGRIANLGYLFLPLSLTLALLRDITRRRGVSFLAVCGLVVCLFTNPLSALVIAAHLAIRFIRRLRAEKLGYVGDTALFTALVGFTILFVVRGGESTGAVPPNAFFAPDRLIETVGARSFLYPLVFGFYEHLTDQIVAAVVATHVLLALWALCRADNRQRLLGLSLGACLVGTTLVVIAARPWLTDFMNGYGPTFPDRYFIAQNVFAILLVVWILSRLPRFMRYVGIAIIFACVSFGAGILFEFDRPQMIAVTDASFAEQIAQAASGNRDADPNALILLDAYPDSFGVILPARIVVQTAAALSDPAMATPSISHLDLDRLPMRLAAMEDLASVAERPIADILPLETRAFNDLVAENGTLSATGGDPYVVYGYSGAGSLLADASRLSFDLVCVGRTRPVRMQLFWQTRERPGMEEARSLSFTAHPGRNVVPFAIHPSFTSRETVDGIRLDIVTPRACPGYRFEDVALERR